MDTKRIIDGFHAKRARLKSKHDLLRPPVDQDSMDQHFAVFTGAEDDHFERVRVWTRVHLTRAGGLIRCSSVSIAVDAPNLEFTSTVTLMYADYSTRSDRDKIIIIIITHAF